MDKRELLKRFSYEGFTLRPKALQCINEYADKAVRDLPKSFESGAFLESLLQNIKRAKLKDSNEIASIIDEAVVNEALDLQTLTAVQGRRQRDFMDIEEGGQDGQTQEQNTVEQMVQAKLSNSVIVLDTQKDIPSLEVGIDSILKAQDGKPAPKSAHKGEAVVNQKSSSLAQKDVKSLVPDLPTNNSQSASFLGVPDNKVGMQIFRYKLVRQKMRLNSNYIFANNPPMLTTFDEVQPMHVSDVGSLMGSGGQRRTILGLVQEGLSKEQYMQDEFARTAIDTKNARINAGQVTVNAVILARGQYDDKVCHFVVEQFFQPKWLSREALEARQFQKLDLFGASSKIHDIIQKLFQIEIESKMRALKVQESQNNRNNSKNNKSKNNNSKNRPMLSKQTKERQKLLGFFDLELNSELPLPLSQKEDQCVVVMSDFNLHSPSVLKKFESLLSGFERSMFPICFIVMGRFFDISQIRNEEEEMEVRQLISEFKAIIERQPTFKNACWLLVPHLNDIGLNLFPRKELPASLFEELTNAVPQMCLVCNPCRVSIFGKEFVFYRNDLLKELRKQSIVRNEDKAFDVQIARTILSQSHLSPLNHFNKPIVWQADQAMSLVQLPHYLVIGDSHIDQFDLGVQNDEGGAMEGTQSQAEGTKTMVINPGSFSKKAAFSVIYPLKGVTQLCTVP